MRNITLFESDNHRFILLNESEPGEEECARFYRLGRKMPAFWS
jgi:hypothetical protein